MRASLQQALSDFTLKWIHNQGFSAENLESTEFLITELERYIKNSTNPLVMVTELFARKQEAGESIESFVTWIREHAKLCEFEDITDVSNWFTMLCLCCNVTDTDTRHRLVKEKGLTFERAVEICLEEEKTLKTSKQLARGSAPGEACATSSYQKDRKNQQQAKQQGQNDRSRSQSRGQKANGRDRSQSRAGSGKCFGCGQAGHRAKAPECRAADKVCHNCNKKGHLAKMCHAPKKPDSEGEGNTIFLGSLTVSSTDVTPLENIEVTLTGPNGMSKQVRALPDTGANISCITPELYKEMGLKLKDLEKEDLPARTADKTPLGVLGKAKFRVTLGKFQTETTARVVKNLSRPILSLRCCKDLHLVPENFPHGHVEVNVTQVDNVTSVKTGYPELDNLISRYPQVSDGRCKVVKGGQKRLREVREEWDRRNSVVKPFQHPPLHPGQTVRIQDPVMKRWRQTGTIIDFGVNEREYRVKADNGRIYRRNRKFLKPEFVKAEPPPTQPVRAPELPGEKSSPQPEVEERAASPSLPSRAPTGTTLTTSRPGNLITSRPKRAIRKLLRFCEEENQVFNI
jgi:hypothetical protein